MTLDPSSWPGGGGGGVGATFEVVSGNNVSIGNNATDKLTWNTSAGPSTLLDRTSTDSPFVIAGGVYAVTLWVATDDPLTAGGIATAELRLDTAPIDALTRVQQSMTPATADPYPNAALSMTRHLAASAALDVRVINEDGVAARNFNLVQAVVALLG